MMLHGHGYTERPAITRRRFGLDPMGRQVYEAKVELRDSAGHIIEPGELFTTTGTAPLCGACRTVRVVRA